jgi:hypothetical protein
MCFLKYSSLCFPNCSTMGFFFIYSTICFSNCSTMCLEHALEIHSILHYGICPEKLLESKGNERFVT